MPRPHTPIPCTQTHPGAPNALPKQHGVLTLFKVLKQQNSERATTHSGRGTPGRALPARERRMGGWVFFLGHGKGVRGTMKTQAAKRRTWGPTFHFDDLLCVLHTPLPLPDIT